MAKIAIIGTGISGLSAAFLLQMKHELVVYEKEARIGGHSRTVTVQHGNRIIPVDTGFIVYNERNYPNLTALFKLLGVSTKDSNMSFAMSVRDGWLEWGARSFNAVFGQRRNIFNWRFLNLFREVMRFNAQVTGAVKREPGITLGEFVDRQGFSDWFKKYYLLPMGGAIWSCPPTQMLQFPAQVFVDFFENHGLLAISGQPQWRTVDGGSQVYVEKLVASFRERVRLECGATGVQRVVRGVRVLDAKGGAEEFDHVIFACHADEALACLRHDLLSGERRTPALDHGELLGDLVGAVDVDVAAVGVVQLAHRDLERAQALGARLRARHGGLDARPSGGQGIDEVIDRGTGADADHGVVLDVLQRGFGRRFLERIGVHGARIQYAFALP